MTLPLCFVLAPFGQKHTSAGTQIDFDAVYQDLIKPTIEETGFEPFRNDEEIASGIIHKPMFERQMLCQYAVYDLTSANANVFYELGLRQAVRPHSTLLLFAEGYLQLPFDVATLGALPYKLGADGKPIDIIGARNVLKDRMREIRDETPDSSFYQIVEEFPDIQRLKTDVFRDRVRYSEDINKSLAAARLQGVDAVQSVEKELGVIADADSAVVVDLFLSYRAVKAWEEMIVLAAKMSPCLSATLMVQEQLGFALNRSGRKEEAEQLLLDLITKRGSSSETYSILGGIYKDKWEEALITGDKPLAGSELNKAIDAYLKGFEADWRDAFPGINAVTLMELKDPPDERRKKLVQVVSYAVERRISSSEPDYWDYATLLEVAILAKDEKAALTALNDALVNVRELWEPETTVRNLSFIREVREKRGEQPGWATQVEHKLKRRAQM